MEAWKELNERQQTYLRAIYTADQASEKAEAARWKLGQRRRPAAEWRWLLYSDFPHPTHLKSLLRAANVVDPGTGSTFEALRIRKLIQCRQELDIDVVWIQLTTYGRKVARAGLGHQAPKKLPTGTLREWHWEALAKLYVAGSSLYDDGVRSGYYGGIGWNTWLRLRDYQPRPLVKEINNWNEQGSQVYGIQITDYGKEFYQQNRDKYMRLYPGIDAPPPNTSA